MIYVEDNCIKVGGTMLPGLFKSLEVTGSALVEEQEVEGSSVKPKQATGYEDTKVNIELVLYDTSGETALQKLARIHNIFQPPGQTVPQVLDIVEEQLAARGVSRVIFKGLTSKQDNKAQQITATLTFWEYIPMVISAAKGGAAGCAGAVNLSEDYSAYLPSRGKTADTPVTDDRKANKYKSAITGVKNRLYGN